MRLTFLSSLLYIIFLLIFSACGVIEGEETSLSREESGNTAVAGVSIEVMNASTDNYKVLKLNGDKSLQVKLGNEKKDLYILFSNFEEAPHRVKVTHNQKQQKSFSLIKKSVEKQNINYLYRDIKRNIQEFNNRPLSLRNKKYRNSKVKKVYNKIFDVEDETTKVFYMGVNSQDKKVNATARKVIADIETSEGAKSLTIWVEDDAYGDGCIKAKCVNQKMINTLADKFLKEGADNDIYDWVTNVFGEEWGDTSVYSDLIPELNHIDILLTDISNDNKKNGGVIGYFYSKDNFKASKYKGSNERIMFYIDSVMYANEMNADDTNGNGSYGWDENDFWPQQVFSTLAHEFQHMIFFYHKNVQQNIQGSKAWINEMLSESTEDLLAVKMNVDGPRNVIASRGDAGDKNNRNGRYPIFNKNNHLSPFDWDNQLENYSAVSSFGTYLLRNYGGAELLHNIVFNDYLNEDALIYAVHQHINGRSKSLSDLIHEWGVAVLLSKRDDIAIDGGMLYNAGDFISSDFNGIHYDLGSINFFNYSTTPTLHTSMSELSPLSNYYYKVGEDLTGEINLEITETKGVNVSVVVVK